MVHGALLLKRLQQQQQEIRKKKTLIRRAVPAVLPAYSNNGNGTQNEESNNINGRCKEGSFTVEVCLGPDCATSGSGAAILEIEELCSLKNQSLDDNKARVVINIGGCRDICTMGPNILIDGVSFSQVNSPAACRQALQKSGILVKSGENKTSCNPKSKILQLREDGRRWRANREKAALERRLQSRQRKTDSKEL